ncbi:hypothetical protein FQA47_019924 [Oryzias melastigma]|uniref:Uncharacterized protein n=1 Tax=Oryzias melastigma TaxID=30732 RepID=A0A834FJV3_ORYME|nr:hypothetical protein FQA47_019924 [Oryzias melastigma]
MKSAKLRSHSSPWETLLPRHPLHATEGRQPSSPRRLVSVSRPRPQRFISPRQSRRRSGAVTDGVRPLNDQNRDRSLSIRTWRDSDIVRRSVYKKRVLYAAFMPRMEEANAVGVATPLKYDQYGRQCGLISRILYFMDVKALWKAGAPL